MIKNIIIIIIREFYTFCYCKYYKEYRQKIFSLYKKKK